MTESHASPGPASGSADYDVAVIGGALAGAASAILLLRSLPNLRVLIIEKSDAFGRRVGEATVEISGFFLTRVLGLTEHLNQAHLIKQGMRFWFHNNRTQSLVDCSEIGGSYLARLPSFQVDRAVLDQQVLTQAMALGAQLRRPASVRKVTLTPGGAQVLEISAAGGPVQTVSVRWVVDASGVGALLARQQGWFRPNSDHPTSAAWARWTGVKDWDGLELANKYPKWSAACHGIRGTATNHFVGRGWWAWCIPLKGGDVSIGVVFDERLVEWPKEGPLGARIKQFLSRHPVARELLANATWREGDVHWRKQLPYYSTTFAGDGFALVGDAAAFLDPFYSPGMDGVAYTVTAATQIIAAQLKGEDISARLTEHNRVFARSYERWFKAIYLNKYEYLGDFELMRVAFLMDVGLYYLGVASQPYKRGAAALVEPVFSTRPSVPFYYFISFYNRRFASIARNRYARGTWGKDNAARRFLFGGYTISRSSSLPLLKAIFGWAMLELTEGWRTWFKSAAPLTTPGISAQPEPSLADTI